MNKKDTTKIKSNALTVDELLSQEDNYGLYTIINNITGLSGSIMREPDDKVAYERAINHINKIITENDKCVDKLSNFSLVRLGVYNLQTSTIINMDRLVMPFGDIEK